ncbi:MAG: glycosyltransferase [Candidatus Sungbacteria bacterium]|uniref:Glycosyltransferase n=1 Tax=Candidatus Sungiibacteriota bacterium TaxID=2750080 RepID=A0A9D6QVA4_9BACT|nr:glycosyltransferase [Candidatus Sungbacteria bacterium]
MKKVIQEYYDARADEMARWHGRRNYYHQQIRNLLNFLVPRNVSLLEVGSGTGDLLSSLNVKEKKGIDISSKTIELSLKLHPGLDVQVDDIESLRTRDHFDCILFSELVGSLYDIQKALENAKAIINEEGRLVIIYHNYLWQPVLVLLESLKLKAKPPLQNWLSPADLENFLALAGFEVIKSGRRVLVPVYIPVVSWFFNQIIVRLPLLWRLGLVNYVVARPHIVRQPVSVSVVVAARNEKGNIEKIIERVPAFPQYSEIIFIEGGSSDGTWEEIERVADKYKGKKNITIAKQDGKGKGDAVHKGFGLARGELLMILDADMTVAPEDLPKFYEAYVSGRGDFINGSRLVYPMEKQAMRFLNILGNKFFATAFSWLLSQRIKDTLCGTKVLSKSDYLRIAANRSYFGDFDPFGDYDLLFGASKLNLKIIEVPIRYKERTYGSTNIQRFRHGLLLLQMCIFAARKLKFNP